MSRRSRDLTTKTDPRYGPWRPMRGARGEAEQRWQELMSPWRITQPQSPLVPARGNMLRQGAEMTTTRRAGRWRA